MAATADKSKPYIPLSGLVEDGWSSDTEATATCFCGKIQLKFPTSGPGVQNSFVCNCTDCRKITASMFASNFTIHNTHLTHVRGQELLKTFAQSRSIATGHTMTNYFCGNCGILMYRISSGFPTMSILRIGTIDDFNIHDGKLKPTVEQYVKDRVQWKGPVDGAEQVQAGADIWGL